MEALPLIRVAAAAAVLAWVVAPRTACADPRLQIFTVAVPGDDGRVSLGVFSPSGSLVRSLGGLAPLRDFPTGLNGLILEWDGTDERGHPVPAGAYRVAGWAVPETVAVRGVEVHFNDWPASDGSLPLGGVAAVAPGANGEIFVAGPLADGTGSGVWSVGSQDGLLEERVRVAGKGEVLCADASFAVLRAPGGGGITIQALDRTGAAPVELFSDRRVEAAAVGGGMLFVSTGNGAPMLTKVGLEFCGIEPVAAVPPAVLTLLAADGGDQVFASDGVRVWQWSGKEFFEVPLGDPVTVSALAAGGEGTVWVGGRIAAVGGHAFVRQYAPDGSLLREWKPGHDAPSGLFAGHAPTSLFVLTREGEHGPQHLLGLRPVAMPDDSPVPQEGVADWEMFLDRSIHPAPSPAFAEGVIVPSPPDNPAPPVQSLKVRILPNSLNETRRIGELRAAFDAHGAWIETADGLRIADICELEGITRAAIARGDKPDTLRVLVTVPGGALEYAVAGLRDLVHLDGGTIKP